MANLRILRSLRENLVGGFPADILRAMRGWYRKGKPVLDALRRFNTGFPLWVVAIQPDVTGRDMF